MKTPPVLASPRHVLLIWGLAALLAVAAIFYPDRAPHSPRPAGANPRPTSGQVSKVARVAGDAVRTPRERLDDLLGALASGPPDAAALLVAALDDPDPGVRMNAVEQASGLPLAELLAVCEHAARSADEEVRQRAWSLLGPVAPARKAALFTRALASANSALLEEVLREMGAETRPPHFEALLHAAAAARPAQASRLLSEIHQWLVASGGPSPRFRTPAEALAWWNANRLHYDEFLLRTDPPA